MRRLLRTWLWMLALSLGVGLAIGTCVRREAEQPARYIGERKAPELPRYAREPARSSASTRSSSSRA